MEVNADIYRGCLLGLAVGDAMGSAVDALRYRQICDTYGPAGLLGYDLANGVAETTSHTQIAAYTTNGLLLAVARGQLAPAGVMRYTVQALREWARLQHLPGDPERRVCWLSHVPQLRRRRCMDARTLDALTRDALGTPRNPANQGAGPGTLAAAVPMGLYFHPERLAASDIGLLGAQAVALTHGEPMAFLSGAALAYAVAGIVQAPECPLEEQFLQAAQAVEQQFGDTYPQAARLRAELERAVALSREITLAHPAAMEQLVCDSAWQVLCGAVYAVLASGADFDTAMIIAVNHSGHSAAVAALAGALLGARLGLEALPEFYLECLEEAGVLKELATDLYSACPKGWHTRLFDDAWDHKYTHGLPV